MKLNKEIRPEFKVEEYMWIRPGEDCWVELDVDNLPDRDGDVFIPAKIVQSDLDKKAVSVEYADPDFTAPTDVHMSRIMKRDPNVYPELTDLVDMPILNDAELHQKIRDRFKVLDIFTYIGPSLLIVNPFKYLREKYTEELKQEFYNCIKTPASNKVRDKPPHVWAIAAHAYLELYRNKQNQACCISGESGAGKTVNTKTCMSFLTGMNEIFGTKPNADHHHHHHHHHKEIPIEDKILMCNPILEALGNAKTVRNDNSSRFGKYISLFMHNKMVIGASVESYLLEAIRVTTPNKSERNYHVFYQFLKGASDEDLKLMRLKREPFSYPFLERSGCKDVSTIDDVEEYKEHEKSMTTLNLQGNWREAYWRIIAAVLHISKVKFDDTNLTDSNACDIVTTDVVDDIVETLQVDRQLVLNALTTKTKFVPGGGEITCYLEKNQCVLQSEAFGKEIYNKLFSWVIKYLNLALLPEAEKKSGKDPAKVYQKIGLLDIFGFEIFEFNSIEQLCINFTNEKLHQLYVEYVFKLEVATFIEEGLKQFLANLSFQDNQEVLDLLAHPDQKKFSVFSLIDDQAGTMSKDLAIIDQFQNFHNKNPKMQFSKMKKNMFFIVHTARAVGYTIDGFCEKNKDEVPRTIIRCVLASKFQRIVDIYTQKIKDADTPVDYLGEAVKKKESFIGYKFRQQMDALMSELRSCQCSFMRCIKPNEAKSSEIWTSSLVVLQIRYLGLLDSIKIRKESYPFRFVFKQFVQRYLELEPTYCAMTLSELEAANPDYKTLSKNIIQSGIPDETDKTQLMGKTKVFLKIEAYQKLEKAYEKAVKVKKDAIEVLDKAMLEIKMKYRLDDMKGKAMVAVNIVNQMIFGMKTKAAYRKFRILRKAVVKLQRNFRAKKMMRLFRLRKQAFTPLQCSIQAWIAQQKANVKLSSAKTILRYYRNYKWNKSLEFYISLLKLVDKISNTAVDIAINKQREKAIIHVQAHARGFLCRKRYAEEVKKIKFAKDMFKYEKAKKTLRKYILGKITRRRVKKIINSAAFIQATVRMKWIRAMYLNLREKTIIIQRFTRDWLKKKNKQDKQRLEYLKKEYIPFLKKATTDQSRLYPVDTESLRRQVGSDVKYEEPKVYQPYNQVPELDATCLQKVRVFSEVVDVDYLKDVLDAYQGSWAKGFIDSHKDTKKIRTDTRVIEVGQTHSILSTINGRCYCWGKNNAFQLGTDQQSETMAVFRVLKGEEKLRFIATGDDHTHILTKDRAVFSFGRNDKGQLGLGHTRSVNKIELNTFLSKCKLSHIQAKRNETVGVTEEGEVLIWPISPSNLSIGILKMPTKESVSAVSLGTEFMMLLTTNGNLYSLGRENKYGQLGLGNTQPVLSPTKVSDSIKERIVQVSCGKGHTICLTRNNKAFVWGEGSQGQLGSNSLNNYLLPVQIKLPHSSSKLLQVCSSYQACYALFEDGTIYWWGRNSRIRLAAKPRIFRHLTDSELFPIQVRSSWSDTINVLYLEIADLRYCDDLNIAQKQQIAKSMAAKWSTTGNSQCRQLLNFS
jgi:myosin-5